MSDIVSLVRAMRYSYKVLFFNEPALVEFRAHRPFQETMLNRNRQTAPKSLSISEANTVVLPGLQQYQPQYQSAVLFTYLGLSTVSTKIIADSTTTPRIAKSLPKVPESADSPNNPVMNAPEDIPTRFINP